jgi:YesN/AraC family two-component response regulator
MIQEGAMERLDPLAILLVEDDGAAREILSSMLAVRYPELTFYQAENGKTGLDSFQRHLPAIIITDVNMPLMSGIRLAEEAKKIAGGVKLIVLTAFSDKTVLESTHAARIGVDHYLMKPIDYRKLLAAIQQCLADLADLAG